MTAKRKGEGMGDTDWSAIDGPNGPVLSRASMDIVVESQFPTDPPTTKIAVLKKLAKAGNACKGLANPEAIIPLLKELKKALGRIITQHDRTVLKALVAYLETGEGKLEDEES